MKKISIVIPTLNEAKYLPSLMGSLQLQTCNDFEVIVADAGSKDATQEIAAQYGACIVRGGKPAEGRNKGAAVATGEFIFFLDADVVPPDDFCECALDEMYRRQLKLATCEVFPLSSRIIDKTLHSLSNLSIKLMQYSANPHAPGSCIMIHRPLFERVGGFDESLYLAEDHELAKRASRYSPLRVLNSTYILVSARRLRKEGRFSLAGKYLQVELHRIFNGEIRDKIFEYEFGAYDEIEPSAAGNGFRRLYEYLQRVNRNLNTALTNGQNDDTVPLPEKQTVTAFREKMDKAKEEFRRLIERYAKKASESKEMPHINQENGGETVRQL
ncbi:MAG: glycosyltransferase [Candidatus Latescibacteria bacterium]|nr:glycosyltransferase [Candidatus Latescibacterota bacterium]